MTGPAKDLQPYRIEWRANLTTGWVCLTSADTHDEALETGRAKLKENGGQTRVITQHVIAAYGLGEDG